jgi:hypothetical protein
MRRDEQENRPRPRPRRKRPHAAARSRVVAGVMSVVAFAGLGVGFARTTATTPTTKDAPSSVGSTPSTSDDDPWDDDSGGAFVPAVPGGISSGQNPITSSGGS